MTQPDDKDRFQRQADLHAGAGGDYGATDWAFVGVIIGLLFVLVIFSILEVCVK